MAAKKAQHPHGHYCKICGEYKANEKFSGKGHAAHICKTCSRLSTAEKAEAMTINRLMNLPFGRLSANDRAWLENRLHDSRTEVAELAKEVYRQHFPHAERNKIKKQLVIRELVFEIHAEVFDEYGDMDIANKHFTADRSTHILTMKNLDESGTELTLTLDGRKMASLLRWAVHALEIFAWEEDYCHGSRSVSADQYLDLLPEYRPDDMIESDCSELTAAEADEASWRVKVKYTNGTVQETDSYEDYLPDRVEELYLSLLGYFEPDPDELFDENESEND